MRRWATGIPDIPIEEPEHGLTYSGLQFGGDHWKSSRNTCGETELTGFMVRARKARVGEALSRDISADRYLYSFVEPSTHPAGK